MNPMIRLNIVNPVVRALLMLLITVFLLPLASAIEGSGFVVVVNAGETKNASGQTLRLTAQATFFTGILVDTGNTTDCASHEERWEEFPVTSADGSGAWEITNPDHSKFGSGTWEVTSGMTTAYFNVCHLRAIYAYRRLITGACYSSLSRSQRHLANRFQVEICKQ